jgi:hypothetical protein
LKPTYSAAVGFAETPAVRDLKFEPLSDEEIEKIKDHRANRAKGDANTKKVKRDVLAGKTAPFTDPAINDFKHKETLSNVITNPIQNFDGPDADTGQPLFGTRFIPPDTNAAVGPGHVVLMTNMGLRIYDKVGNPLTAQFRFSQLLVGIEECRRR